MANNNSQQMNHLTGQYIDNGALELVSIIGLGAYGVVYKALARDGKYYAVKCLNKTGLDSRQRGFQRREIALHTLASSHPNIVTLHNVIENSTCIYVVLAYCPDGDLFSQITENSRYLGNDALIKDVFLQIVDAVDFCHRLGIYHRDLKPENILCDAQGARVVLADFGLATAEKTSGDFGCGSTFYMSPECQGGLFQRLGSYSTLHNDIWSLGVILVNLTCGRNPWKQACPSDETFRLYLSNPDYLRAILPISKQCNELLKRIFALNPANRISIKELKAEVKKMGRWTMTYEELRYATPATKEAARSWAPAHILDEQPLSKPPRQPLPVLPEQQQQQQQQQQQAPRPKLRPHREPVFNIAEPSIVEYQQQAKRAYAKQQQQHQQAVPNSTQTTLASPILDPSCPASLAGPKQTPIKKTLVHTRSDFSLSESEPSSDEGELMDYVPVDSQNVASQTHQHRLATKYPPHDSLSRLHKNSPPPLSSQCPRTPRQLFATPHRPRKQSIESASSCSSASSDASWTGLPPTPDTPIFSKRSVLASEKEKATPLSIGAKLKLAF